MRLRDLFSGSRACPDCGGELIDHYPRLDLFTEFRLAASRTWKIGFARVMGMDEDRSLDSESSTHQICRDCGLVTKR